MTRIRDLSRKSKMSDQDVFPVFDSNQAATRSVSFKILRDAVPNLTEVVYTPPNLILTQSDGSQFTVNISDAIALIDPSVQDNDLVFWDVNTNTFMPAGANKDPTTGVITFDQSISVPAGSINVGATVTLSEGAEELIIRSNVSGDKGFVLKVDYDDDGSTRPSYINLASKKNINLQPNDPDVLTANPIFFSIIGAVKSPFIRQTNQVTFRADIAMPNVTAKITDTATGIVIRYVPSKVAFDAVTAEEIAASPGLNFISGDNIVDFNSVEPSSPGVFNIGILPFRLAQGQQIDIEFKADNVNLRGILPNFPFITQRVQDGQPSVLAITDDTGSIEDPYIALNTEYTGTSGVTSGIVVNFQATSTATTISSGQFTAGVPASSNASVITVGSSIFTANEFIQISGTKLNDGFYEVLNHSGTQLSIRGVGGSPIIEDFTEDDFVNTVDSGTVTKVNLSVIRAGIDGDWEVGQGSVTGIVFKDLALEIGVETIIDFSPGLQTTSGSVPLAKATIVIPAVDETFIIEGTAMVSFSNVQGHSVTRLFNRTDLSAIGRQWEVEQEDSGDILSPVFRQEFVQTVANGAKTIELQYFVGEGTGTLAISDGLLTAHEVTNV